MSKKINVVVLMGGESAEHEISIISGNEVIKNLDPKKYNVLPLTIKKNGNWQIESKQKHNLLAGSTKTHKNENKIIGGAVSLDKGKVDVVFIALHGTYGEDGRVQGLLDLLKIPYTGSGLLASALAMDKDFSRHVLKNHGLNVPKCVVLTNIKEEEKVWKKLSTPVFVKPKSQGSSVGISKVNKKSELKAALKKAFSYDSEVLVEEFIDGTEVTCGILGNENPMALPLVEIVTKHDFFDYEAKYDPKLTDEIVPARVSKKTTKDAQTAALIAYKSLNCKGFGRVDMIIKKDKIYVLEVNTIPGLTPVSLLPKAARAAGFSYQQLLDKIISLSLKK